MEDYFCFGNPTGVPCMTQNNEAQSTLVPLNSLNSSFKKESVIAPSFKDLPASIPRMEQWNVDSTSGQNDNMNLLVSGTNLLMHNNSLLQMNGSTYTYPSGNFLSPLRSLESNRVSNSVMPGFLAAQDGENNGNGLKRKRLLHSIAATSEFNTQGHQIVSPPLARQDPGGLLHIAKMPRLDANHEDLLQQHLYQQFLLRKDLMQVQNQNMQLKALIQQQRQQNYLDQQILQPVPTFNRPHGLQKEDQLKHLLQSQQTLHRVSPISSFPVEVCSRRLMQYLYHLRNRPQVNNIGYWRKLVSEYYAPGAKIRWCFSLYKNLRTNGRGGFMHTVKEGWACDVCGSRSGKGFEANFEILPRVFQNNFGNDLVDEILFLEMPQERKVASGLLMLEYGKAVLKSVYKRGCVVREGKLRVFFGQDLKILSWEICAFRHEELLERHQISSQVYQLVEAAEKCQTTCMESAEDFKSNCNKFAAAGHHLAKTIDLPLMNGLGLPNRYVRCLQIAEVFNTMVDLMAFSSHSKMGPIECLKYYGQTASSKAIQKNVHCGKESTVTATSFSPCSGSGSVDSCLIHDQVLHSDREVSMAFPCKGKLSDSPTGRVIKQEKRCVAADQKTEIPITSRVQVSQSPYCRKFRSSSVNIGTKRADFESFGVTKNLEQQLGRKKLQERVTSNTAEGENVAYTRGRMVNSSTMIESARVPKALHSSNSSYSRSSLEIKQEPNFF